MREWTSARNRALSCVWKCSGYDYIDFRQVCNSSDEVLGDFGNLLSRNLVWKVNDALLIAKRPPVTGCKSCVGSWGRIVFEYSNRDILKLRISVEWFGWLDCGTDSACNAPWEHGSHMYHLWIGIFALLHTFKTSVAYWPVWWGGWDVLRDVPQYYLVSRP